MQRGSRSHKQLNRIWIAMLALAWSSAGRVHAHGGPPAALGIVAADENGPNVVLLNEGLAVRDGERWSFVCPRLWGDESVSAGKVPLARNDGTSTWIVGSDDLYVAKDGMLIPQERPDLTTDSVVALEGSDAEVFGLRRRGTMMGSEIIRLGAGSSPPPVWSSDKYWSTLSVTSSAFFLARVVNDLELGFLSIDREGAVRSDFQVIVDSMPAQVELRPTPDALYALLFDGNVHNTLGVLEDESFQVLREADAPIQGPQPSPNGQLWVSIDGRLNRLTDHRFEPSDETQYVTCLGQWRDEPYACVGSALYWLADDGLGERIFQLDEFSGPNPSRVPAEASEVCGFQWLLFRNDLERGGLSPRDFAPATPLAGGDAEPVGGTPPMAAAGAEAPPPTAAAPAPPSGGCSSIRAAAAYGGQAGWSVGLALLASGLVRARRRRSRVGRGR